LRSPNRLGLPSIVTARAASDAPAPAHRPPRSRSRARRSQSILGEIEVLAGRVERCAHRCPTIGVARIRDPDPHRAVQTGYCGALGEACVHAPDHQDERDLDQPADEHEASTLSRVQRVRRIRPTSTIESGAISTT
jgi:hypothetical protein